MNNILIVDDEADICALLTEHLRKLGFKASSCLTIRDARECITSSPYDVIFIDLNLADGSGYELISLLKAVSNPVKIVVISAYDSERQRAMQSGASMFVPKPFTKGTIQDVLKSLSFISS